MSTEPTTRVLFNWKPRHLDHGLADRFRKRLAREGWYAHPSCVQVRGPVDLQVVNPSLFQWHHDEGQPRLGFLVWSNVYPTEVRFADGSLLNADDGDVIFIINDQVEHRAPEKQTNRWFIRTGLAVQLDSEASVSLLETVITI